MLGTQLGLLSKAVPGQTPESQPLYRGLSWQEPIISGFTCPPFLLLPFLAPPPTSHDHFSLPTLAAGAVMKGPRVRQTVLGQDPMPSTAPWLGQPVPAPPGVSVPPSSKQQHQRTSLVGHMLSTGPAHGKHSVKGGCCYEGPTWSCFCIPGLRHPVLFLVLTLTPLQLQLRVLPTASTQPWGKQTGGLAHASSLPRVSRRIRQAPDCPDTDNIPGGVNTGKSLQRILGTRRTSPLGCWWPRDVGPRDLRRTRGLSSVQLVQLLGCRCTGPSTCLAATGSAQQLPLSVLSGDVPGNSVFSQTAYVLGRAWHLRGSDSQPHGHTA